MDQIDEQAQLQKINLLKAALRQNEEEALAKRLEEQREAKKRVERRKIEEQEQLEAQHREEVRLKMEADIEINRRQRDIDEKLRQVKEQEAKRIELEQLAEKAEQDRRDSEAKTKAAELFAHAEAERAKNIAAAKEIQKRALQEERKHVEAILEKERQETAKRLAVEQQLNEVAESDRIGKIKAQQAENARNQARFLEENHRKLLEDTIKELQKRLETSEEDTSAVNVDYPQTQAGGEKAAEGTDGSTGAETMSPHLRQILRQISR